MTSRGAKGFSPCVVGSRLVNWAEDFKEVRYAALGR